ncbi:hypothetical protein CQW23_08236 [Capsicum baccatum]|uniref:Ubiquitin-like protease family profile domain-containing protein n=1 Tax=Capsicum baccatum TaxID=33114 RepID=A0A2G2X8C8_CAPBA|nr:hypothetical protein CQW23_08236 [Capsicum baccatum]
MPQRIMFVDDDRDEYPRRQLRKSGRSKEIRLKFRNDEVKMMEIKKKKKGLKRTPSPREQKNKRYEKKRKSKEIEGDVDKSYDEYEEESEEEVENRIFRLLNWKTIAPRPHYEFLMNAMFKDNDKVVFKNIKPTEMELAKLEIPQKDVQSKADSHVEEVVVSKRESHVEKEAFTSKKVFDAFCEEVRQEFKGVREKFTRIRQLVKKKFKKMVKEIEHSKQQHEDIEVEAQQMNYAGVETSPQQFSPTVDQNLNENQDGTKGCTDFYPEKANNEIDSQYLIPNGLLQSINLDYNFSEKTIHHEDRITDEKLNDTNLSDSQFIIPNELLPSLNAYRRESITRHPLTTCEEEQSDEYFNDKKSESIVQDHCQHIDVCFYYLRKKSKYYPNRSYKFSTVDCNFMNIIRSIHNVYSADTANLTTGGHVTHLNEYINEFRMHAAMSWHIVEDIYIPVNIREKHHWVLAILSFSERCIFLYDSYESSGHYSVVLDVIEKLATITPLCLQHCDFYVMKGIDVQNYPRYKDKDSSDMFDVLFQESLPQQPNGSLDCGVYMVTYVECLSYGHKVLANEFGPNALCTRYTALLWEYGIRKQDANAHSDVEAPLRPTRQSRITSITEVFDV